MNTRQNLPSKNQLRVLITGGAGFIAPYVIKEFLSQGCEVSAVDKSEFVNKIRSVNYIRKDVRDIVANDLKGINVVIHLAFLTNIQFSISSPISTTDENIGMTVRLLKACSDGGVERFLYPSTASLYGGNPTPWNENLPVEPLEPYSFQKHATESLIRMWSKQYGLRSTILRLFQVYSEQSRSDGVLSIFLRAKAEGRPITVTKTKPGAKFSSATRDFIHLSDVARAFYACAVHEGYEELCPTFNVGTGVSTEISRVAEIIGGEIISVPNRGYEVDDHLADITKIERVIGWKSEIEFEKWLIEFVRQESHR